MRGRLVRGRECLNILKLVLLWITMQRKHSVCLNEQPMNTSLGTVTKDAVNRKPRIAANVLGTLFASEAKAQ